MDISTIILSIIVLGFMILAIWNGINFKSLKGRSVSLNQNLNDSKYFELKYKQEFLIAIVSFITAIAAFLGYNSLAAVKSQIRDDVEVKLKSNIDKIDSLKHVIAKTDSSVKDIKSVTYQYSMLAIRNQIKENQLRKILELSELKTKAFQKRIEELNSKSILKQEIYIVEGVEFDVLKGNSDTSSNITQYFFADLKTILGEPLPKFTKPPIIVTTSNSGAQLYIIDVTTISFKIGSGAFVTPTGNETSYKVKVNLLISEIPN